jgi:hypothetical protein
MLFVVGCNDLTNMRKNLPLTLIEILVLGGIVAAFLLPLFSPSDEAEADKATYTVITNS